MCIKLTRMQLYNQLLKSTKSTLGYWVFISFRITWLCLHFSASQNKQKLCLCKQKKANCFPQTGRGVETLSSINENMSAELIGGEMHLALPWVTQLPMVEALL